MWSVSVEQDTPKPLIIQSNHLLFCPMQPILVDQNRPSLKPVYFLNGIIARLWSISAWLISSQIKASPSSIAKSVPCQPYNITAHILSSNYGSVGSSIERPLRQELFRQARTGAAEDAIAQQILL